MLDVMQFLCNDRKKIGWGYGCAGVTPREGQGGFPGGAVPSVDFSKEADGEWGSCRVGINVHPCTMMPKMAIRGHFPLGY